MSWLNTPGGHIFVSMILVAGGQVVEYLGMGFGREITVSGMAILARSMWGASISR